MKLNAEDDLPDASRARLYNTAHQYPNRTFIAAEEYRESLIFPPIPMLASVMDDTINM